MNEKVCRVCGVDFFGDRDEVVCSNACEIRADQGLFEALEKLRFGVDGATGDDFKEALEGLIDDLGLS